MHRLTPSPHRCVGRARRPQKFALTSAMLGRIAAQVIDRIVGKTCLEHIVCPCTHRTRGAKGSGGHAQHPAMITRRCAPVARPTGKQRPYAMEKFDHPDSAPGIASAGGGILSYKESTHPATGRGSCRMRGIGDHRSRTLESGPKAGQLADIAPQRGAG